MKKLVIYLLILTAIGYNVTQAGTMGIKEAHKAKIEALEGV